MSVQLEVEEIATGDYSPEYGHVLSATRTGESVRLIFVNGTELNPPIGAEMEIDQGGRF